MKYGLWSRVKSKIKNNLLCYIPKENTVTSIQAELIFFTIATALTISILILNYKTLENMFRNIFTLDNLYEGIVLLMFVILEIISVVKYILCKIKNRPVYFINAVVEAIIAKILILVGRAAIILAIIRMYFT